MYSFSQIASILQAPVAGNDAGTVRYLSTDSRRIHFPAETLFFAIVTPQRNGHAYLPDAYAQGVRQFVVSDAVETAHFPGAGFIGVNDALQALQLLARQHRQQFHYPVIGITGSNGKTVVKEWLTQILQGTFNIVRSPRSYNSQIGVPLSLWQMEANNEVGIFEAGISQRGEMQVLAQMIQPTIGIFTALGTAHDAGFDNHSQKLQEKIKLFASAETVIYNANDLQVKEAIEKLPIRQFAWGYADGCALQILEMVRWPQHTSFVCWYRGEIISFDTPFTDNASLENAVHCFAACLLLSLPVDTIKEQLLQLQPLEMRLEWKKAINNCYLINDSYSNDLTSLLISLDYLQQQSQTHLQTVILSDIFQTGIHSGELYEQVANLLAEQRIERLIGIGPAIFKNKEAFLNRLPQAVFFTATEELLQQLDTLTFRNEAILLKGARAIFSK